MKLNIKHGLVGLVFMLVLPVASADVCTDLDSMAEYWEGIAQALEAMIEVDYTEADAEAASSDIAAQVIRTREWAEYFVSQGDYTAQTYGVPLHQWMYMLEHADDWDDTFDAIDGTIDLMDDAVSECAELTNTGVEPESAAEPYRGTVNVLYMPPSEMPGLAQMMNQLRATGVFETMASIVSETLILPVDLPVYFANCGVANAYYDPSETRITMCYEYLDLVASNFYSEDAQENGQVLQAVMGVASNVLLHEIGHALVDIYKIPITGREEDSVDSLAALILLAGEQNEMLFSTMLNWATMAKYSGENSGAQLAFHGEHSLNSQRFYDLACLVFGSDPEKHMQLVEDGWLPESRAMRCPSEFKQKDRAWDELLSPYFAG